MWIGCQEFCFKLNGQKSDTFLESGWNLIVFNQKLYPLKTTRIQETWLDMAVIFLGLEENLLTVFSLWISLTQNGCQESIKPTRRNLSESLRVPMPHRLVSVEKPFLKLPLAFSAFTLWQRARPCNFLSCFFILRLTGKCKNGFKTLLREPAVPCSSVLKFLTLTNPSATFSVVPSSHC